MARLDPLSWLKQPAELPHGFLWILVVGNLLGTLYGFYFYHDQLLATEGLLKVFVPASPTATLLLAFSLLLRRFNRSSKVIEALAYFGNVKYGFWTILVLIFYSYTVDPFFFLIFASHLVMGIQAFLVDFDRYSLLIASSWFMINDAVDYRFGTYTSIGADPGPAFVFAFLLTGITSISGYLLISWRSRNSQDG